MAALKTASTVAIAGQQLFIEGRRANRSNTYRGGSTMAWRHYVVRRGYAWEGVDYRHGVSFHRHSDDDIFLLYISTVDSYSDYCTKESVRYHTEFEKDPTLVDLNEVVEFMGLADPRTVVSALLIGFM
ncbi:hypothetical protein Tco_0665344 [Tanacetum coccineum]